MRKASGPLLFLVALLAADAVAAATAGVVLLLGGRCTLVEDLPNGARGHRARWSGAP